MDQITNHAKNSGNGYTLTTGGIKIFCYAKDAVSVAKSEGDLQRLLYGLKAL